MTSLFHFVAYTTHVLLGPQAMSINIIYAPKVQHVDKTVRKTNISK